MRTSFLLSRATFLLSRYFFSQFSPTASGHMIPSSVQGSRYSTPDGRLTIFACDLFDISSELVGDVDAVWDRGSFVALSFEARPRYVALLKSLVGQSFRWVTIRIFERGRTFFDSDTYCKPGSTTKPFILAHHTGRQNNSWLQSATNSMESNEQL